VSTDKKDIFLRVFLTKNKNKFTIFPGLLFEKLYVHKNYNIFM